MIKDAIRNEKYDFINENYNSLYPQIHKYPATMLPQIGVDILKELNVKPNAKLLDPYCGSGSSFASALEIGINEMIGYDLNPLAILISSVKFTKIDINETIDTFYKLKENIYELLKTSDFKPNFPNITNFEFWFKPNVANGLAIIKECVDKVKKTKIKRFFLVIFSELVRECSNTRNNEFKLFKMKDDDVLLFNPDVAGLFSQKAQKTLDVYQRYYVNKLDNINISLYNHSFDGKQADVVLTSPPYGDSRTTVAYGQFSTLSNEWLGVRDARKIDKTLMGGSKTTQLFKDSLIYEYLSQINNIDNKRALEVSSFYNDLSLSIQNIASSINKGGKAVYIVGNRMVKGVRLPTDKFIAEAFEKSGLSHIVTYERLLSNKSMPKKNSPTNEKGKLRETMNYEYIVCCEK
ncbi:modification methylase [Helicobacter pylori]|uniref:modification methylase n=1 Tax=Helicobacter pylori TaxID=210 RepID=UPI001923E92A|nr:modification methylase [Helicobacter pylori]WRA99221.1 modification methylase [Helicobacter pylori]